MSLVFHAPVMLLTMNFRHNIVKVACRSTRLSPGGYNVMTKFIINKETDAYQTHSPDGASTDTRDDSIHLVDVLGEHGRCQAINGIVGSFDQLIHVLELHDLHHWSENLQQ